MLSSKRYADKIDTSKSIKYLDTQIKHIIEVYIKKMDKGESWLLAKKPIGGFTCASCEAYIGELKDKDEYLAWNKYPMREPQDKGYRIGNGFSRMLNMLNLDVRGSYENGEQEENKQNLKVILKIEIMNRKIYVKMVIMLRLNSCKLKPLNTESNSLNLLL